MRAQGRDVIIRNGRIIPHREEKDYSSPKKVRGGQFNPPPPPLGIEEENTQIDKIKQCR